jgi:flavin-binding protein dodecin
VAVLTEGRLLDEAGDTSFERGQDYVKYVVGLRVHNSRATASIQAKNSYQVELDCAHRAGAEADFATYLSELRETYRRRPALMSALDRQGL